MHIRSTGCERPATTAASKARPESPDVNERTPSTPDRSPEERTDELLDRVLASSPATGARSWEDLRQHADGILGHGAGEPTDGRVGGDIVLAAAALKAAGERPIPTAVVQRHLQAMHDELDATTPATTGLGGRWSWRRRLAGAAAAVTAFTTAGGGTAVAFAQEAAPGDALYGVKRASEQVRLALELDPQGDAALHLELAQRRLDEAEQAPGVADDLLDVALEHIAEAEDHGDAGTRAAAAAAGQRAVDVLTELLDGKLPETASDQARAALERARDRKQAHIDARADGQTGRGQAPGQQTDREPGAGGRDRAPGQSDADGHPEPPAGPGQTGAPDEPGPPEGVDGGPANDGS